MTCIETNMIGSPLLISSGYFLVEHYLKKKQESQISAGLCIRDILKYIEMH